jgi:hypothetical protein
MGDFKLARPVIKRGIEDAFLAAVIILEPGCAKADWTSVMTAALPNTIIHLPPQHRRSASEIGLLLFVGIVIPLLILWLLLRAVGTPMASPDPTSQGATAIETPLVVEVVMQYPTSSPTPEETPRPSWTPSPSAEDFCDPQFTRPGDTCTKPFPPPPTPTPLLSCMSQFVDSGERCRWPESTAKKQFWN